MLVITLFPLFAVFIIFIVIITINSQSRIDKDSAKSNSEIDNLQIMNQQEINRQMQQAAEINMISSAANSVDSLNQTDSVHHDNFL